jgi:hypothetical protein
VIARANTRVDVLRGTYTDGYGDTKQDDRVVAERLAVSLVEESQSTTRRASNRPQTMRYYTLRPVDLFEFQVGDRVRDTAGVVYTVDDITAPTSPFGTPSKRLRLRRAT